MTRSVWASIASTTEVGWGRVDGGEIPGRIDNGREDVCHVNEGGGVFNSCVHGVVSTAVEEEMVATADAASEVEVAEKRQLRRQPWRPWAVWVLITLMTVKVGQDCRNSAESGGNWNHVNDVTVMGW